MQQNAIFFRKVILGSEKQLLPATIYNLIKHLIRLGKNQPIHLPIKSLQSIAVIKEDEILFVDIHMGRVIEFSWKNFKPQSRKGLSCPVAYEFVWHNKRAQHAMLKAPIELEKIVSQKIERINSNANKRTADLIYL